MNSQQTDTTTTSDSATEESTTEKSSPDPQTPNPEPAASTGGDLDSPAQNEQQPPQHEAEDPNPANAEAAKYRRRLREAEAQRDAATAKLESVLSSVIEQKLQNLPVGMKTLKAAGVDLSEVYDDAGTFSDEHLLAAVEVAYDKLGLPEDPTMRMIRFHHERSSQIRWDSDPLRGYVPSAGTGGERPHKASGWESVINP